MPFDWHEHEWWEGGIRWPRRPKPPKTLWPWPGSRTRPDVLVDQHRVLLADPDDNIIGLGADLWGRGGPIARVAYARRSNTRDL